jgi:hypothetical protein
MTDVKPRYQFVVGTGDDHHAQALNELPDYKATLIVFDSSSDAIANHQQIVVLMERESQ